MARRILLGAVLGVAPLIAFGVPVTFGGFEMELSECASLISPDRLRLAPADNSLCTGTPDAYQYGNRNGSAYIADPFSATAATSFESAFSFQLHNGGGVAGADGFTFIVTNSPAGNKTLSGGGHLLGAYDVPNSLVLGFRTYVYNEVVLTVDSMAAANWYDVDNAIVTAPEPFDLNSGGIHYAWVEYDGLSNLFNLFLSSQDAKPSEAFLSAEVDLLEVLGGNQYYAGFTGAVGGATNDHDILSFNFSSYEAPPLPEPTTLALMAAGLAGIGLSRRRKKTH